MPTFSMAECVACGREISVNAQACPNCGETNAGKKAKEAKISREVANFSPEKKRRIKQSREQRKRRKRKGKIACWSSIVVAFLVGALFHSSQGSVGTFIIYVVLLVSVVFAGDVVIDRLVEPAEERITGVDLHSAFGLKKLRQDTFVLTVVLWPVNLLYMIVHVVLKLT